MFRFHAAEFLNNVCAVDGWMDETVLHKPIIGEHSVHVSHVSVGDFYWLASCSSILAVIGWTAEGRIAHSLVLAKIHITGNVACLLLL